VIQTSSTNEEDHAVSKENDDFSSPAARIASKERVAMLRIPVIAPKVLS
jgi:hypothetical protein